MQDFPHASLEDWENRVRTVLKDGADVSSLVKLTQDGVRIDPLSLQNFGPRAERAQLKPWDIMQRLDHPLATRANAQGLAALEGGADGLVLVSATSDFAYGAGLKPDVPLDVVLAQVKLHAIALRLDGGLALALARFVGKQPLDPERLRVSFGLGAGDAAAVPDLLAQGFTGPFITADGRRFHNHGATEAEELACVLADATRALRALDFLDAAQLVRAVDVTLSATQDMFLTLAKFRAMRLLWLRVLRLSGLPEQPLQLHGESSWRMMSPLDPHSNILRGTAAVFGASLGGADSFSLLPFSSAQGLPNDFARRVARNSQLVLREEGQLWRVMDPASGSGTFESLTGQLCDKAWDLFQQIEATGDYPPFDAANPASLPIIGTTRYPLAQEYEAAVEVVS